MRFRRLCRRTSPIATYLPLDLVRRLVNRGVHVLVPHLCADDTAPLGVHRHLRLVLASTFARVAAVHGQAHVGVAQEVAEGPHRILQLLLRVRIHRLGHVHVVAVHAQRQLQAQASGSTRASE